MTIDNVPQAKWLATAPPDDVIIARLTKVDEYMEQQNENDYLAVHVYFDTGTDMMYKAVTWPYSMLTEWLCTDPNRKGVFE
jgi:hypothetical protein